MWPDRGVSVGLDVDDDDDDHDHVDDGDIYI